HVVNLDHLPNWVYALEKHVGYCSPEHRNLACSVDILLHEPTAREQGPLPDVGVLDAGTLDRGCPILVGIDYLGRRPYHWRHPGHRRAFFLNRLDICSSQCRPPAPSIAHAILRG